MSVQEATRSLSKFNVTYSGSGSRVIDMSPEAGSNLAENSTIRLMLSN